MAKQTRNEFYESEKAWLQGRIKAKQRESHIANAQNEGAKTLGTAAVFCFIGFFWFSLYDSIAWGLFIILGIFHAGVGVLGVLEGVFQLKTSGDSYETHRKFSSVEERHIEDMEWERIMRDPALCTYHCSLFDRCYRERTHIPDSCRECEARYDGRYRCVDGKHYDAPTFKEDDVE